MVAVEIVQDRETREEFAAEEKVGARINQAMQQHGLFSRMRGDVVCLAPPVVITSEELDRIIAAVTGAIGDVLGS
jgi:adenosylmethionine-8-amino-7-oxononanoate aminotransferase